MAMPSGNVNVVVSDKLPGGGGPGVGVVGGGGEMVRQWFIDERDGFISWLRSEFAAANAIIDALCHHLRVVGEVGEYDGVVGCIQQRRCNWNGVLHMQQYFSVGEVLNSLQQVNWRKGQRVCEPGKGFRRGGGGGGVWFSRQGQHRVEGGKEEYGNRNDSRSSVGLKKGEGVSEKGEEIVKVVDKGVAIGEEKFDMVAKPQLESCFKGSGNSQVMTCSDADHEAEQVDDVCASNSKGSCNVPLEKDSQSMLIPHEKQNPTIIPKTFVGTEIFDGKTVNVVDGMKLYEELLDDSEVLKLVKLVNDLRAAGRRGQLQGRTFVVSKRPMKGHGREMIQLGQPAADALPEDEAPAGTFKDRRIEPVPGLLQDVIERLIAMQIISVKPDSCIIDIFNEGDHSQPHMWPYWFGRPVSVLFLTECDVTFGKLIGSDYPGNYRGAFKLSPAPGSMLVMQGRSTDIARHALPSVQKQRILVTLMKSQPKRTTPIDGFPSTAMATPSNWVPPPSRSPNHFRPFSGQKRYGQVPTNGLLPATASHPQVLIPPPPNGIQPIFVPAPVAPVALPPVSAGWTSVPPRHPPPRLLVPGTGVFLPPPGSGNSSSQSLSPNRPMGNISVETPSLAEKDNCSEKPNGNSSSASPEDKLDEAIQRLECNGSVDVTVEGRAMTKEEQPESL